MHMQHTVHEAHILKIMSFISSRVNHTGNVRKLSLTIMTSRSRSAEDLKTSKTVLRQYTVSRLNITGGCLDYFCC